MEFHSVPVPNAVSFLHVGKVSMRKAKMVGITCHGVFWEGPKHEKSHIQQAQFHDLAEKLIGEIHSKIGMSHVDASSNMTREKQMLTNCQHYSNIPDMYIWYVKASHQVRKGPIQWPNPLCSKTVLAPAAIKDTDAKSAKGIWAKHCLA